MVQFSLLKSSITTGSNLLTRGICYSRLITQLSSPTYRRSIHTIRNVGVVAHIDAGKTTTSEQMLYLCGETKSVGRVDSGDTVMDFLPQERERGITISSAAISFKWKDYNINLIDTPGHVDFTIEVERSARVLDGCIVVVDAVAGVQSQTRTVWKQTQRQSIPAIAFINKMDRDGADFNDSIHSIKSKLCNANPVPMQYPIGSESNFAGVVDLLSMNKVLWDNSVSTSTSIRTPNFARIEKLSVDDGIYSDVLTARRNMIDSIAEVDEILMNKYLEDDTDTLESLQIGDLISAIRRACIQGLIVPALCGASLRGKGVEPLLDAIAAFLPSPIDRRDNIAVSKLDKNKKIVISSAKTKELCALAFKVVHDKSRGLLVYARIYSGTLSAKQVLCNSTSDSKERLGQLLVVSADDFTPVASLTAGQVGCLVGLKNTKTGDTLVSDKSPLQQYILDGLSIPKAVFSLSVEPEKASLQTELEEALEILVLEDPSLKVEVNKESGQTVLKGIGELHLEIVCDKLKRDFGIEVTTGRAYVAYRETIYFDDVKTYSYVFDRLSSGKRMYAGITYDISSTGTMDDPIVEVIEEVRKLIKPDEYLAVLDAMNSALSRGTLGFPVIGLKVTVKQIDRDNDTTSGSIRACISTCINNMMRESTSHTLLEPIMSLDVEVPSNYVGDVISDLTVKRRAIVKDVMSKEAINVISATVPLATMLGYATSVRSLTQGEGTFSMEYLEHSMVDSNVLTM